VRFCTVVAIASSACSFEPSQARAIDAARTADAQRLDATDGADAAMLDAYVPADVVAIQSLTKPYGTDDDFSLLISATHGDVLIAATYASEIGAVSVTDSAGLSWTSLTRRSENTGPCDEVEAQFWYAVLASDVTTTVDLHQTDAAAIGMQLIEYSGVSTTSPIDGDVGGAAPNSTMNLTTPPITTSHDGAVLAIFADVEGGGMMTPGSGWTARGSDTEFFTLLVDNAPGSAAGTFVPSGGLPGGASNCWVGAAIGLRAR
jgi:hypothetical protein